MVKGVELRIERFRVRSHVRPSVAKITANSIGSFVRFRKKGRILIDRQFIRIEEVILSKYINVFLLTIITTTTITVRRTHHVHQVRPKMTKHYVVTRKISVIMGYIYIII